ncbi:MAG TPA: hypothetical protein VNJ01_12655 [Bacteriovoracaceae bacterium]|nr:hypothetical protein [Bacteriovoracaceae bacterium]
MNWFEKRKKAFASLFMGLFVVTGTYNAIVINSESHISGDDIRFVKRLDEVYGITTQGRDVAASLKWQKIPRKHEAQLAQRIPLPSQLIQRQEASPTESAPSQVIAAAAIQEELNLTLAEVINPRKWPQPPTPAQFSGSLSTNNGSIEDLSVSLPGGEGFSISFIEMTGNVFEYDFNGELYSGMLYQVDQKSYMVSLTNGPLEGTRLRFSAGPSEEEQQQIQQQLSANHNIEVGTFGDAQNQGSNPELSPESVVQTDQSMQEEAQKAQLQDLSPASAM